MSISITAMPTGPFETNCLLIHDGSKATVVDPGLGAKKLIDAAVSSAGLEIEQIVLTHGHIDHIRDLPALQKERGVTAYMNHGDLPLLSEEGIAGLGQIGELHDTATMDTPQQPTAVNEGDTLTIAGVVFHAYVMPGHSPGSVMYRGQTEDGVVIVGGDVLFRGGIGRTDLPLCDPQAMVASLSRMPEIFEETDRVIPGHGPETTVGQEYATNSFLRAVLA